MPIINTDAVAEDRLYAVTYDSSPETIIIKDDVLVYLYSYQRAAAAVYNDGFPNGKLINYGHVIGDGGSYAVGVTSRDFYLYNMAGGDISAGGTAIYFEGNYNGLENAGHISGRVDFRDGGSVDNTGVITGHVTTSLSSGRFTLANAGTLDGGVYVTVDASISYSRLASIDNSGSITGGIYCLNQTGNFSIVVHNTGHIAGDVTLSGGSDTVDNRGGQIGGVVSGGAGDDTYVIDATPVSIVENDGEGSDTLSAATISLDLARYHNIEKATLLGGLNLNAAGDAGNNVLTGNAGTNVLKGLAGNDVYFVQNAGDQVVEAANAGKDTVHASVSYALSANVENLILDGSAAINGTGNAGDNVLTGNGAVNRLAGGAGNDTYVVDNAGDVVIEATDTASAKYGTDTVIANVSYVLAAGQAVEALKAGTKANPVALTGNEFAQTLTGNAGANVLDGQGGNDLLTGGKGADTFVFSTAPAASNLDHIADFSAADETIRLAKSVFAALSAGSLSSDAFKDLGVSGAAVDADDRILYDHRTGSLAYDADGSGQIAAVPFAVLDNKAVIGAADFFVV